MSTTGCNNSSSSKGPHLDPDYFLNGIYVCLQVENTIFRVPTHAFTSQSEFFAGMFSLPQGDAVDNEGSSDSKPIVLPPCIRAKDFKNFLKLLYPLNSVIYESLTLLTKEDWISILKLATMWYFIEIRKVAFKKLDSLELSAIEKIVLGRETSISKWVVEGYSKLVVSPNISDEEVPAIGPETTIKLYRLREERLKKIAYGPNPLSLVLLRTSVEEAFRDELEDIRSVETGHV